MVLLIFAKYLCTYKGTHTQAHMYNQHMRGMATTRYRSLVERGERKALLETLHTNQKKKCQKKIDIHESQEKIRVHRASSKATRLMTISYDVIKATSINHVKRKKQLGQIIKICSPFTMFPNQEPGGRARDPARRICTRCFEGGPLP